MDKESFYPLKYSVCTYKFCGLSYTYAHAHREAFVTDYHQCVMQSRCEVHLSSGSVQALLSMVHAFLSVAGSQERGSDFRERSLTETVLCSSHQKGRREKEKAKRYKQVTPHEPQ